MDVYQTHTTYSIHSSCVSGHASMRSYYTTREIMRGTSLTCRRSKFHRRPWRHEARYKARQAEETYHPTAGQRLEHTPQNGEQTARASAHAG